jgi:hypothetical protein
MAKSTKLTHPKSKREMNIDAAIYEPFKAAIIQSLKGSKGKTYTELNDSVAGIIKKKIPGFKGSVSWYTITVRLDLENRGLVETFTEKGKKLNRLKPPSPKGG